MCAERTNTVVESRTALEGIQHYREKGKSKTRNTILWRSVEEKEITISESCKSVLIRESANSCVVQHTQATIILVNDAARLTTDFFRVK
ncbi:hypothetical protein EBR25_12435 [bacterium]|nr:hypothetical protein [bacterium]